MNTAALLLIPLIAGYFFATTWYGSKFTIAREDGHRLYFRAGYYGTICLLIGSLLHTGLNALAAGEWVRAINYYLHALNPSDEPLDPWAGPMASIFTFTLLTGFYGSRLLNWLGDQISEDNKLFALKHHNAPSRNQALFRKAVAASGNQLQLMILDSVENQLPLLITTQSGKVYVGYVLDTPEPSETADFRILPMLSGYRDAEQTVRFTTRYVQVYERLLTAVDDDFSELKNFGIVLPVKEIRSAALFDPDIYSHFSTIDTRMKQSA